MEKIIPKDNYKVSKMIFAKKYLLQNHLELKKEGCLKTEISHVCPFLLNNSLVANIGTFTLNVLPFSMFNK